MARRRRFSPGDEIVRGILAWELLGEGRCCETWLAWSVERWTQVVVKLPLAGLLEDEETAATLRREGAILAELAHPCFQHLFDDRTGDPVPHLVLEYVEGPTLADLLHEEGPFLPGDVTRLGMQIASGLHYLAGLRLVHLDLKPGNLLLREGRAVIVDLDLARHIGEVPPPGRCPGTPPYMAPEQCRREAASPAMDVFALGAVLYELATGVKAFNPRREASGWRFPQLRARPARPSRWNPDIPPELEALILVLMEPDPGLRPTRAFEVLKALTVTLEAGQVAVWPEWVGELLGLWASPVRGTAS